MPSNVSNTWYTTLVAQDPVNRYAIQRPNGGWIVIDYSAGLRVLSLHSEAKVFNFTTKDISIAEKQNHNAGYIFSHHKEAEQSLIPLLPGYVVFTAAGNKRFKLSILES